MSPVLAEPLYGVSTVTLNTAYDVSGCLNDTSYIAFPRFLQPARNAWAHMQRIKRSYVLTSFMLGILAVLRRAFLRELLRTPEGPTTSPLACSAGR